MIRLDEKKVVEEAKAIHMWKKMYKERIVKAKSRNQSQNLSRSRLDERFFTCLLVIIL